MSASGISARADFVGGLAWIAFGSAIVVASVTMDRLEKFGATLYTAPGLVPGVLGAAIVLLGLVLAIRSIRRGALAGLAAPWSTNADGRAAMRRTTVAAVLSLVYTLGLIGRVPFPIATALFVFAFIGWFGVRDGDSLSRRLGIATIAAVVTAAVVTVVFERVFLVRLP